MLACFATFSSALANHLLLYRSSDGLVAVGYIDAYGQYQQTEALRGVFVPGWTDIVAVGNRLLLYRYSDGLVAVGYIDGAGQYRQTETFSLGVSITQIRAIGGYLLLYSGYTTDGPTLDESGSIGYIDGDGQFQSVDLPYCCVKYWSQIVAVGNDLSGYPDRLLFYRNDGRAEVGHIGILYDSINLITNSYQTGYQWTEDIYNFAQNWSQIVAVGD